MKAQRAEMLVHLRRLDAALPGWRGTATGTDAAPVLAALDGVNGALAVHLPDEETNIVPVMECTITEAEVKWFSDNGRRSIPKGQTWQQLGEIPRGPLSGPGMPAEYLASRRRGASVA